MVGGGKNSSTIIPVCCKMQLEGFASGREYGYKILLHNENHGKAGNTARIYIDYVLCVHIYCIELAQRIT